MTAYKAAKSARSRTEQLARQQAMERNGGEMPAGKRREYNQHWGNL
jgi:hypothetical protein